MLIGVKLLKLRKWRISCLWETLHTGCYSVAMYLLGVILPTAK